MAGLLVGLFWLSGCGAPGVQLAAPVPAPERARTQDEIAALGSRSASQISSETLWITVRDARQERSPHAIGVARMTMGIPREIRQAGGWDLARAIGHGLGTGLQNAGWDSSGFDPPARKSPPATASSGWTLRLVLDRLWCDGYFNEYSFQLGLRLHLLDPSGRLRSRAEFRKEYVEEYKHPADLAYQAEVKTREALSTLLLDLGLSNFPPRVDQIFLGPRKTPLSLQDGDYFYNKYEKSKLDEDEDTDSCPECDRDVEAAWKHCPDCGASLPEPK
jgi:hypothetical protein